MADLRQQAGHRAITDPKVGLTLARQEPSAWNRAQALAWVGRFAPGAASEAALRESAATAQKCSEPFQVAAVLAWPIRAAYERGYPRLAKLWLQEAIAQLPLIDALPSKVEALALLWDACYAGERSSRESVRAIALRLCPPDAHWRARRLHRDMIATLAMDDPSAADAHLAALPAGRAKDHLATHRSHGETRVPRPFYWAAA